MMGICSWQAYIYLSTAFAQKFATIIALIIAIIIYIISVFILKIFEKEEICMLPLKVPSS